MLNFRVSDEEAAVLAAYAEECGLSMTDVVRGFIRSLEGKMRRIKPETVQPHLLPSVPLTKVGMVPSIQAVYFLLTEDGNVLYVGETDDLYKRFVTHHRHEEALNIDAHARVHWLERRTTRKSFERACVKRFQPPLNKNPRPSSL